MQTSRRPLLGMAAAAGGAGLAGCLGGRGDEVPEPSVTTDRFEDGWRLADRTTGIAFAETFGPITVRAREHTVLYERTDVAEAVAGTFDAEGSPVIFFATRMAFSPAVDRLPLGIGHERVMAEVRAGASAAFQEQLRDAGLERVRRTGSDAIRTGTGHEATAFRYAATFPLEGSVELADGGTGETSGAVEMVARLAVWHDGATVLLAGGAFPLERLTTVIEESLPEGSSPAEEFLTGDGEALGTDPETFAAEVATLVGSVE